MLANVALDFNSNEGPLVSSKQFGWLWDWNTLACTMEIRVCSLAAICCCRVGFCAF